MSRQTKVDGMPAGRRNSYRAAGRRRLRRTMLMAGAYPATMQSTDHQIHCNFN